MRKGFEGLFGLGATVCSDFCSCRCRHDKPCVTITDPSP
jgi:hypothetical protein